jgi:hypothetical protein
VSCRVVSCRVVSCRVVSCRVVSCRVVSCRVVPLTLRCCYLRQDEVLRSSVIKYEGKSWKKIASCLPGRTDVQCLHRWQKVLKPGLVKGPWTAEVRTIPSCLACVHPSVHSHPLPQAKRLTGPSFPSLLSSLHPSVTIAALTRCRAVDRHGANRRTSGSRRSSPSSGARSGRTSRPSCTAALASSVASGTTTT